MAVRWQAEVPPDPRLLVLNEPLAAELGLDAAWLRSPDGLRFLVGASVPDGATPVAQAYAGHQFGGFVPAARRRPRAAARRARRRRRDRFATCTSRARARTPFARGGDGLAAVGPMLREYVVSEAMHALGIPTTRSLAVVATGARCTARRCCRAPCSRGSRAATCGSAASSTPATSGDIDLLRRLADHAIARHHPAAAEAENPYLALFEAVVAAQASLVAQWMLVGFVHGVMNTDNMTISGETIDYGPCAFMDAYDPATVFSSIDTGGRYAYGNQPAVAEWNLARLRRGAAAALRRRSGPRRSPSRRSRSAVSVGATPPPGRPACGPSSACRDADDDVATPLIDELLALLAQSRVDHTSFFRLLGRAARGDAEPARGLFLDLAAFDGWLARWRALGSGRRRDGPGQPGLHPAQPPGRGGPRRGDRRRPRSARTAARRP